MPHRRDEWLDRFRQRRADQIRLIYRQRIRRKRLKGGSEHDRSRIITQEQLEHAHDSGAYDPVIPGPSPRPEDSPGNGGRGPSKPDESWLPSYIPDEPSPTEQSSGQESGSESDRRGSTGSSKPGDAPDAGRGTIDLPDFIPDANDEEPAAEEVWPVNTPLTQGQEMHVDHLLSAETDILAREVLITLKRDGLPPKSQWNDFMAQYALWSWHAESDAIARATLAKIAQSDWDKRLELADLQQEPERQLETRVGMGGGPGDTNVDDANITNLVSRYQALEDHLTSEFGIDIEWGEESNDMRSRLTQLQNLDRAIDYIVYYLTWRVYDGDERRALDDFKQYFGRSEDHGQLVVRLGANAYFVENFSIPEEEAGYYSFVPLPPPGAKSVEGVDDNWDMMFLGSNVDIATIVHEFGHVIDRSLDLVQEYNAAAQRGILLPAWQEFYEDAKLLLTDSILQYGVEGFAGKQNVNEEFWADLFMTAVLDSVVGGPLTVYSSTYERIENLSPTQFDRCIGEGACSRRPVEWADQAPDAFYDFGALAQEHFPTLWKSLLNG